MMQLEMVNLDWKVQDKEETNAFVFLAKKNNTICGWALIFPKINQFFFQVFIKEKYRRKGIGTKLFTMAERHVIKKNKNMFIFPWDNTSLNFYKNQNPRAIFNIYEF